MASWPASVMSLRSNAVSLSMYCCSRLSLKVNLGGLLGAAWQFSRSISSLDIAWVSHFTHTVTYSHIYHIQH